MSPGPGGPRLSLAVGKSTLQPEGSSPDGWTGPGRLLAGTGGHAGLSFAEPTPSCAAGRRETGRREKGKGTVPHASGGAREQRFRN